jgi:parallel beta-helix repeat protein
VAYNSATHSGDGLFLWAGNSTMDTGEGGANDNLFFYNDFSFAPTNGIEVTFSRNRMLGNIVEGNRYGVWGGYSWESEILGNCFARNQYGVAIEHGQDNRIVGNRFDGDSLAVSLWSRESEPEDWGYPRHRDTASRDHLIADNVFAGVNSVWRLEGTRGVDVLDNRVESGAGGGAGSGAATTSTGCDPRALLGDAFSVLARTPPGRSPTPRGPAFPGPPSSWTSGAPLMACHRSSGPWIRLRPRFDLRSWGRRDDGWLRGSGESRASRPNRALPETPWW